MRRFIQFLALLASLLVRVIVRAIDQLANPFGKFQPLGYVPPTVGIALPGHRSEVRLTCRTSC